MTGVRRRPVAVAVWLVLAAASVVAALSWPAGPLIVGGVDGEPFPIGPLLPGWSLSQEVRPERGPELFVGFSAQPSVATESPPTVEVRLERDAQVLWADRLRLTGAGMTEYVATFPVPTDGAAYRMAVRVLEAPGGGVVLGGVDIREPTAKTQLTIMGQQLRGFLALGHRMFQRVSPVQHLEAVASAIEGWTIAVAAGVGVAGMLVGAAAAVLIARVYGRLVAVVATLFGVAALAIWLFVAAVHLSVPIVAGVHIGVLNGLTPTGLVSLIAFPVVVVVAVAAILIVAPRAAGSSAAAVAWGLWHAAVTAVRHWYLAPVLLGGAAAGAVTQDADDIATVLAVLTGAWALLAVLFVTAVPRLRSGWLADEGALEDEEGKVAVEVEQRSKRLDR